ncbi:MAG TPA: chromosome segregation protein SMC, partial [Bacteroidota bacterium]|nr:chromosome segregation protein SMC [Bacteroidota bacterium]
MYLSKIEVIGFKSFAQRINVNFDSGVTAIVGPNGCGKTNIVDAIRWALGEQRYSTLRSDKMEDVIFNGTKNRKPLGLAEVSLTIENTKGILPTEYSEVTVTRRVFRSGESEYQLNKVPCRLKDILDLFMDTGMGSDAYSVIELKMVESILSDKADERRKLFEEAAGVTKYKHRRKAAIRKLEDVRLDLSRVNDIVKEVQKNVNSLERQAKKAEQHNEASTRLRTLEVDLQEREYAYNHGKLRPLEEKFTLAQTDRSVIDRKLREQDDRIDALRENLQQIEVELAEAQRTAAVHFETIHHTEEKTLVANEKVNSLQANIERYEKEKSDLRAQSESLSREQVIASSRRDELEQELSSSENLYRRTKEEHQGLAQSVDQMRNSVQSVKDVILALAHDLVQKRGEHERLKSRVDNLKGRVERAAEDNALYRSDIERNQEQIVALTAEDRELRKKFAAKEVELGEREKTKKELKLAADGLQQKAIELRGEIERRTAKTDFLKRMIETNEGYSEGARYLLSSERWKGKRLSTVADIVRAGEKYRNAVETAIADVANCLVVDQIEDGYAAIRELKNVDKGKATFICLQWIPKVTRRSKKRASAFAWASQFVECDEKYRPLLNFLLDDVIIVETLDEAKGVLSSLAGVRCVTVDGEILSSSGIMRGGSRRLDEGGLIGKKEKIKELEHERTTLQAEHDACAKKQNETSGQHDAFEIKTYTDAVKSVEKEMTSVEMRIAQLEFEKKRANDGIERNNAEIASVQLEINALQSQYEETSVERSTLENRKSEQESAANRALRELETLEMQFGERTKSLNELEIKVVTLQGDFKNIGRDIERADARSKDIELTLVRREEEISRAQEEILRLSADLVTFNGELATLRTEHEAIDRLKREIEQTYSTKRNELHGIELKIKDERRSHDEAVAATHDLEMKISELKSVIEHIRLRAKEEFEMDL